MAMGIRRYVILDPGSAPTGVTRHFVGLPPVIDRFGVGSRELAGARALIIEEHDEGFFLFRLDGQGNDAGDTWHENLISALDQASIEYGGVGDWREVPSDAIDTFEWVKSRFL